MAPSRSILIKELEEEPLTVEMEGKEAMSLYRPIPLCMISQTWGWRPLKESTAKLEVLSSSLRSQWQNGEEWRQDPSASPNRYFDLWTFSPRGQINEASHSWSEQIKAKLSDRERRLSRKRQQDEPRHFWVTKIWKRGRNQNNLSRAQDPCWYRTRWLSKHRKINLLGCDDPSPSENCKLWVHNFKAFCRESQICRWLLDEHSWHPRHYRRSARQQRPRFWVSKAYLKNKNTDIYAWHHSWWSFRRVQDTWERVGRV